MPRGGSNQDKPSPGSSGSTRNDKPRGGGQQQFGSPVASDSYRGGNNRDAVRWATALTPNPVGILAGLNLLAQDVFGLKPDYNQAAVQAKLDAINRGHDSVRSFFPNRDWFSPQQNQPVSAVPQTAAASPGANSGPSWQELLQAAYGSAYAQGQNEARRRGLNPNEPQWANLLNTEYGRIRNSIPQGSTNFGQYFTAGLAPQIFNQEQERRRAGYNTTIGQAFGPGYDIQLIPDSFDDLLVDQLVGEQRADANRYLDNALARGNLNSIGYGLGLQELDQQGTSAYSSISGLGDDLLQGYRQDIRDDVENLRRQASSYTLGQSFNPSEGISRVRGQPDQFSDLLEGDLRSAIGNAQYFQPAEALNTAGTGQGFVSGGPGGQGITPTLTDEGNKRQRQRGLGNQGAF